jgi:molecular chaperone DnaJ
MKRRCQCSTCKGSKAKPGTKPQKCHVCQGSGFMTFQQGMMILRTECQNCNGIGTTISSPCGTCSGNGYENVKSS